MELSWSTFVLEIINFLVLVWILKRFLYRPVLDMIDRRRAAVEESLSDATKARQQAEELKDRYSGRLADWDRERQQKRDELAESLKEERSARLNDLEAELEQEREKSRKAEARRLADEKRRLEQAAMQNGARFAAGLLREGAGPDLEARLVDIAVRELKSFPQERISALRAGAAKEPAAVLVTSAFPVAGEQSRAIEAALQAIGGRDRAVRFELDGTLLAGLRISAGDWVLALNLRDELQGFADLAGKEPENHERQPD